MGNDLRLFSKERVDGVLVQIVERVVLYSGGQKRILEIWLPVQMFHLKVLLLILDLFWQEESFTVLILVLILLLL